MKNFIKKQVIPLIIILIIITILSMGHTIYSNGKISEAKQNMLLEEIEGMKITDEEKEFLQMKIKNDKIKKEKEKLDSEIKIKNEELKEKTFIEECTQTQIMRKLEGKEVIDGYCEQEYTKKQAETLKIDDLSNGNIIIGGLYEKDNFKVLKSNLFICKEVKEKYGLKSDEFRCATFVSLVAYLETENGSTGIGASMNNMFGIKNPTDTSGLVGNWKYGEDKNIIFETKEMSISSFAYYYMTYHNHRSFENFTNKWVGWSNINYQTALEQNYDWIYNEYNKLAI